MFGKRTLKKESPNIEKTKKSIKVAKKKLEKAHTLLELNILDMSQVNTYAAMFHASRSILFRDGFKEKSHYAIHVYLSEKYSNKIPHKFLNELNVLRLDRHEIFYGIDDETELNKDMIGKTILLAREYIELVEKIIGK